MKRHPAKRIKEEEPGPGAPPGLQLQLVSGKGAGPPESTAGHLCSPQRRGWQTQCRTDSQQPTPGQVPAWPYLPHPPWLPADSVAKALSVV